ncbi:Penicillin-binding protein 4* PBP 4* [Fibrella aestuarina BUZ 2]|uniref:Penicillin-binding protein 4* PBP 4 n=1 Tax=Fibrella aestuarina BUZ 2 TaxID=1166018 RepID=I0KCD7_9BACT|nr:serine hydrolase [Fibrella aestuarina]CCH01790.1 Penicillin-binding protein 4* PBP 4* [Fibrella aestuarina BUZ 2]
MKHALFVLAMLSTQVLLAQTKADRLSELMKTYHGYNMFDGAVLVAENGHVIYKDAYGLANREWAIPNSTDTKFMLGSISKPLTATLVLILVQKGLIDLDETVAYYLPAFKNKPAANVTIRQLLNHTSGMPNYDIISDFFPRISRQYFTRAAYLTVYSDSALAFVPGTRYLYSSWGYFTLGCIIEKVTGKTYAQAMNEEIFSKLNMKSSGSYAHTQIVPKRASGYDYGFGNYVSADFRDQSNTMGTGDLYSTVEDLFTFHMAIANHTLLNKELTQAMLTPGSRPARYGYGWFNQLFRYTPTDSVKANYHLGSTEGFISFMIRMPDTNSMAVILCNSAPTDFFGITKNIVRVLYDKPVVLKEPVHKKMESIIASSTAEKAVAAYKRMKADTAHYSVDWLQLYYLGEKLLSLKRYEDARLIAENNVREFPDRDLVALSMANIYLALNRKEDAINFYRKTLQLNPDNEEAKNRLKEL